MIAIIGAMEEEIRLVKEKMILHRIEEHFHYTFYIGEFQDRLIVLAKCGVGKVMAGSLVTLLHSKYSLKFVINIGTAGGYQFNLKKLDVIVGENILYHDVDLLGFTYPFGQLPSFPRLFQSDSKMIENLKKMIKEEEHIYFGGILTGDEFVTNYEKIHEKVEKYFYEENIMAVDMESAAIAQMCHWLGIPFLIIRSISDLVGKEMQSEVFNQFILDSSKKAFLLLKKAIQFV